MPPSPPTAARRELVARTRRAHPALDAWPPVDDHDLEAELADLEDTLVAAGLLEHAHRFHDHLERGATRRN